ncbi:hypothetical protein NDU88_006787 [Pleurodeles waltl]|uniref:Uncharacterized protein n=1 Tax=Pleurodeles waltl TaxID=8319 RepID=A0AAV7X3T4_PLEWA|nr:hypothetical protein NDU88_006787 [Pleurodeles waltl]
MFSSRARSMRFWRQASALRFRNTPFRCLQPRVTRSDSGHHPLPCGSALGRVHRLPCDLTEYIVGLTLYPPEKFMKRKFLIRAVPQPGT